MRSMGNKRLQTVADCVAPGAIAADIGCDHGKLAAALILTGRAQHVFACDLRPHPLSKARSLAQQLGLTDRITTVLTDGLRGLPLAEITDIIIAGMGGELIARILEDAPAVHDPEKKLILQPMTKEEYLRRFLLENGFEILRETPVCDASFVYTVIEARYDGVRRSPTDFFCMVGRVPQSSSPDTAMYREKKRQVLARRHEGVLRSKNPQPAQQTAVLLEELERCITGGECSGQSE